MAVQDFDGGWCWYRDGAVRTCDKAAAQFYGRTPDSIDFQEVKTDGRAHNIYNGVSCTDFVEMDFIHILVVNSGFGFSQTTEYGKAGCLDRFFERTRGYDCFDVFKISVFMQVLFENHLDTGAVDTLAGIVNYFEENSSSRPSRESAFVRECGSTPSAIMAARFMSPLMPEKQS